MDMMQCWNGYNQKQFYFTEMSRKNVREILCTFLRFMKNLKGDAMGGRGSSSGMSEKEKPYGSEYETIYKNSNIKFVKIRGNSVTAPMETMTRGRVYVTLDKNNQLKHITYYDNENKRNRQIDLTHVHDGKKPHTHHGYYHDENGTTRLTSEERKMVDRVKRIWYNRNSKKQFKKENMYSD